jgi:phenylpropionate dioxygenase-like ring-hydroxylating dioxygenase large terminal subunit
MALITEDKHWAAQYPELGTDPIPIEPCLSPEYHERERERIYRRVWLNVGREDELPRGGDFFVKDIAAVNSSILIVRGKDGVIRGFHNACTHRGNKVTRESRGNRNGFVCGFHGWAFGLKGDLINVTDEEQFFGLDKSSCGLTPVATDVWEGFIFINVDPKPEQTLTEFLGDWGKALSGYAFGSMVMRDRYETEVNVNWKVALDAFQEAWHARFVHKRSGGEAYASKDNPYIHVLQFKLYPLHRMMSVPGNAEFVPTPIQICAHQFGKSYISRDGSGEGLPPGVNPTRNPVWMFDSNYIFPNFSIFVFDGMFFTYHFWPLTADRTLWETRTYYPPAENAGQRFSQEYAKCALRDTWLEDLSTLEDIQVAISSRSVKHFMLQDQEILVRHSHKVIADYVGDE